MARTKPSLMIQRNSRSGMPELKKERMISILIVDDTEAIAYLLTQFLGEITDEITIAKDGAEAVERIANAAESDQLFDVVLMDLHMPNVSGMEAARAIRERGIDVPLIAMTAGGFTARDCQNAGFDGYVTKPFDREKLVAYVSKFIR